MRQKTRVTEDFGRAFRELRQEKGMTLGDFETLGISKSALAKFERGETSMGFERVVSALDKMKISLREFEYRSSYKYRLILEIEGAAIDHDKKTLQKIVKQVGIKEQRLLYLTVQVLLGELNEECREELSERLRELEHWGHVELSILLFTIDELGTTAALYIIQNAMKKHNQTRECQERMLQILYHSIALFCSRGAKSHSQELFAKARMLESRVGENLRLGVVRLLIEGYHEECFGDKFVGLKLEQEALKHLKDLGGKRLAEYYNYNHYKWSGEWIKLSERRML